MSFTSNFLKALQEKGVNTTNIADGTTPSASSGNRGSKSSGSSYTSKFLSALEKQNNMTISEKVEKKVQAIQKNRQDISSSNSYKNAFMNQHGIKTADGYYSRPSLGSASEKLYSNVTALEPVLTEKRSAIDTAQTSLKQAETDLQTVRGYLDQAKAVYDADPTSENANSYNQILGAYNLAYESYASAYDAYSSAYNDYKPYENQLVDALTVYQLYSNQQQSAFDEWRSTIRDTGTIKADMDSVDGEIKTLESEVQTLKTLTRFRNDALGESMKQSLQEAQTKLDTMKSSRELLQEEYDWSQYYQYADLMDAEDFAEKSGYVSTANGQEAVLNKLKGTYAETGFDDLTYDYINRNEEARGKALVNSIGDNTALLGLDTSYLKEMTDEEISIFNYLYSTQGADAAYQYTAYLTGDLTQRQRMEQEASWAAWAEEHPVKSSVFSVMTSPIKGLSYLGQAADYVADGQLDQNAAYNKFSYTNSAIRNQVSKQIEESGKWGKVGSFAYQTGMSMADFLLNTAITGGNQTLSLAIMGTGAAADTTIAAKDRGLEDWQAFTLGTVAGLAEVITEKVSLEALLNPRMLKDGTMKYVLKNMLAEGGEEAGSDLINLFADILISGDQSEWQQSINAYKEDGRTEKEAFLLAFKDQALAVGLDMLGGAISGGIMSGATSAYTNTLYDLQEKTKKKVQQPTESMIAGDDEIQGQSLLTLGVSFETNDRVKQSVVEQAGRLAQATGRDIVFYSADATENGIENGYYSDGKIYVNTRSGNALAQIVSHELTHSVEFAEAYQDLSEAVFRQIHSMGADIDALRHQKKSLYEQNGHALKDMTAVDQEIVADFVEQYLLTDEQTILNVASQNKSLGQKIVEWIDNLLAKLGNKNAQERTFLNNSRNLWANALKQTQNHSASTVQQTQQKQQTQVQQPADNLDTYAEGAKETLEWAREELGAGRMTEEEFDALLEMVMQEEDLEGGNEYSFAGVNAKNANLQTLGIAKELEKQGVADETIRQQTGWFKGMDGKWRWEIDDSGMQYSGRGDLGLQERRPEYARYRELLDKSNRYLLELSDEALTPEETAEFQKLKDIWGGTFRTAGRITEDALPTELLSDYVKHDALFEAYPQLRKTRLRFADLPEGTRGQYDPEQDVITLSKKLRGKPQDTIIHEVQHVIQKAEGFAQGSSPEFWDGQQVVPPEYASEIQKAEDTVKKVEAEFHQEWADDINLNLVKQYIELDNQLWGDGTDPIALQKLADQMDQIEQLAVESGWGDLFNDYYYAVGQLQMAKERAKLHRRTSIDLYQNTAGEIEARDSASRRTLTQEQRRSTEPARADDRTVFVEDIDDAALAELDSEYGPQLQSYVESDFSQEEIENNIRMVSQMDPVVEITGEEFAKGETDLITQVERFFAEHHNSAYNDQLGEVILDRKGVKSDIAHGIGRKKAAAFAAVPSVIEQGYVVDYQKNWKNRGYDTAVLAAPITIGTDEYMAAVILIRSRQTNRFYVHEVLTTKNGAMPFKTGALNKGDPSGDAPSIFSILDKIRGVKNGMDAQERFSVDDTGNQYSISATDKRVIASDLRNILSRGNNPAELRQYINNLERSGRNAERTGEGMYKRGDSAEQGEAQRIIRNARQQGIGVEEFLQQNWEQYDVDGEWNADARAALDQERKGRRYSISGTEEETGEKKTAQQIREEMPAKARNYLEGAERRLLNGLGEKLGVSKFQNRETLQQLVREIADEYLTEGRVSDEKMDFLFDRGYAEGIVEDATFYNENKEIKNHLRSLGVTLSEQDQSDIADYNDFKRRAFGTVRIVKNGIPVDSAYHELHEMAPGLFPESITHPADQLVRMYEVGQSIRVAEVSLQHFYGPEAENYRKWAKNDFAKVINETIADLRTVKRVADEAAQKASEKALAPTTPEEAAEAYKQLKDARRTYEKATAKNLLSDSDEIQVGRLLKGEILPEHLDPDKDNIRAITAVYEAKKEYERITKLIAEYKKQVRMGRLQRADALLETANEWKDKKVGLAYSRETMERNIYDIAPDKAVAERVNREIFHPIHLAEAEATRFKNEYRDKVRGLDLSRKPKKGNLVSEAHAVQLLGEAEDNIRVLQASKGRMKQRDGKTIEEWRAVIDEMWRQSPDLNKQKIRNAVAEFRKIYDELFQQMNEVRVRNGYEPVNYRQGYFPHFQPGDGDGVMAHFGKILGIDTQVAALPTTINGLTHTFRPGIQWFGNAQERLGFNTAYDAVEGFDKYIEGVASVIHQTDNIQMLRAMESQIRYRTTDEGIRKQVDAVNADSRLTEEEKRIKINDIYEHGKYTLSNFVTELTEYTNLLANKKSRLDRTTEALIGRRAYTIMKNWESRVGANMIAGNISSALTNFIPLTQAGAQLDTGSMLKGMWDTLKSCKTDDGISGMSTFLTNRRGSDPLVQTWAQTASEKLGMNFLMNLVDGFTSESVLRAAYYQNLKNGLTEKEAMYQADLFASSVMADRSKGAMPTLFESTNPLLKMFTQFQLEVNNQFSEVFKDLPRRHKEKGMKVLAGVLFKYFLGAFLFNDLYEYFTGRRPALDPFGILNDTVGDLTGYELPNVVEWIGGEDVDFTTEKLGTGEAMKNLASTALGELPFSSGLTLLGIETDGGRIPASSAVPDLTALWDAATQEGWSPEKRWKEAQDELNKLAYIIPPFGGNQIQKVWKGIKAYREGGSYNVDAEGNDILQYPVYKDDPMEAFANAVRMMVMGKNALETAQDWVDSGFDSLSAQQTAVYQDMMEAGATGRESFNLLMELQDAEKTEDKTRAAVQRDILRESDVSDDAMAIAYYGLIASDSDCELMDSLTDMGADAGKVAKVLMDISDAGALKGAVASCAKREAITNSALTEEEKIAIYREKVSESRDDDIEAFRAVGLDFDEFLKVQNQYATIDEQDANATAKATALSRWVDGQEYTDSQAATIKDCFVYFNQIPAASDRYDKLVDAGMDSDDAYDLTSVLNELQPEEGEDEVSNLQKWRASVDFSDDVEDQLTALFAVMTDAQFQKVEIANDLGVSPDAYVTFQETKTRFDSDGNGSYTNAEIEAAINGMTGYYTTEQKAVLWQLGTGSNSARNNPYSRKVGQQVIDARAAAKEATAQSASETTSESEEDSFSQEILKQLLGRG